MRTYNENSTETPLNEEGDTLVGTSGGSRK